MLNAFSSQAKSGKGIHLKREQLMSAKRTCLHIFNPFAYANGIYKFYKRPQKWSQWQGDHEKVLHI